MTTVRLKPEFRHRAVGAVDVPIIRRHPERPFIEPDRRCVICDQMRQPHLFMAMDAGHADICALCTVRMPSWALKGEGRICDGFAIARAATVIRAIERTSDAKG